MEEVHVQHTNAKQMAKNSDTPIKNCLLGIKVSCFEMDLEYFVLKNKEKLTRLKLPSVSGCGGPGLFRRLIQLR